MNSNHALLIVVGILIKQFDIQMTLRFSMSSSIVKCMRVDKTTTSSFVQTYSRRGRRPCRDLIDIEYSERHTGYYTSAHGDIRNPTTPRFAS
jgi:hypothetical protein